MIPKVIENQGDHVHEVSTRRRLAWLKNINRKDWTPGPGARVCSTHFITNKPSSLLDESNPDWAPTLKMGHDEVNIADLSRYERNKRRRLCTSLPEVASEYHYKDASTQTDESFHNEASSQTDGYIDSLESDNVALRSELQALEMNHHKITDELFQENEGILKFYTGLPNWTIFNRDNSTGYNILHFSLCWRANVR